MEAVPVSVDGPPATGAGDGSRHGGMRIAVAVLAALLALAVTALALARPGPVVRRRLALHRAARLSCEGHAYRALSRTIGARHAERLGPALDARGMRLAGRDPRRDPRLKSAPTRLWATRYGPGGGDDDDAWRAVRSAVRELRRDAGRRWRKAVLPSLTPRQRDAGRRVATHRPLAASSAPVLLPVPALAQDVPGHVGSEVRAGCHEAQARAWKGSHHGLAWTAATGDTIVADFDGTSFEHDGMIARFRVKGGEYRVRVTEKDGTTTDYRIHSVAGIEPLRQYLIETEPGRIRSFDVVWDTERRRWFHLYPDEDLPPNDGLHWTGVCKNRNARCAECHATGFEKNHDPAPRTCASMEAEIGVGCECVTAPERPTSARRGTAPPPAGTAGALGLAVAFGRPDETIGQCAGCHSRREAFGNGNALPGAPFHGAHAARLKAEADAVCTQCRNEAGNPRFETLVQANYGKGLWNGVPRHAPPPVAGGRATKVRARLEGAMAKRRLRGWQPPLKNINSLFAAGGPRLLARARELVVTDGCAANACEAFASNLVGDGIKPSSLIADPALRDELWRKAGDAGLRTAPYRGG